MVKETGKKIIAQNKKARHDYAISDVYECGMVLTGPEVKSLRAGRASLIDGYAMVEDGELWLHGVHIPEYNEASWTNHSPRRKRKLLVHRGELLKLLAKVKEGGNTLVPLSLYFKDGKAKIEVAVASELVGKVIEAITGAAKTGQIGDGKIFVVPIEQAVRIRTGERDNDAL